MTPQDALRLAGRWPNAHYLLCRYDNKAPARPWLTYHPTGTEMAMHLERGGLIGVVPATLGYTVLDVDAGQPMALALMYPPARVFPTRRHLGAHLWYRDTESRNNSKWAWEGTYGDVVHKLSGEVRSGRGYVILWDNAAADLLDLPDDPDGVPYDDVLPLVTPPEPPPPLPKPEAIRRLI